MDKNTKFGYMLQKDCFQTPVESSQLISGKINEKIQEVNEIKRMADELFDEYIKTCQVDALNSNKKIR